MKFTLVGAALLVAMMVAVGAQAPAPAAPADAYIQSAAGFDKTAMDATFVLYALATDKNGGAVEEGVCTAFAIQKDDTGYVLLTAGHCVNDLPRETTYAVGEQMNGSLMPVTPISARFVDTTQNQEDYAEFHLKTSKEYPVLTLGDESSEGVGDEVIVPNFAFGIAKQLAKGPVSSQIMTGTEACPTCEGQFLIQIMAAVGASGSPVISAKTHQVVGILVGMYAPLGFVVMPISTVKNSFQRPDQYKELHQIHLPDFSKLFGDRSN